ncbi:MAG TPA: hypothetical protein VN901_31005 [Candidatus Acidoferrales bacterium]|nr:hypothetical protein [Candidatus Acidoferrales bacterium]
MDSFLLKRAEEGVIRRYGPKRDTDLLERAKKQVAHERKLIAELEFAGYFLIVWDVVRFCRRHDIPRQRKRRELGRMLRTRNHRH